MAQQRLAQTISAAGHAVSSWVAAAAAQPLCQAGVIGFCVLWWASGLPTDVLTATLSILAITLTQMVLNHQKLREEDDRRRDVAMHAKLDELLRAEKYARKELAGIEDLEAEEIAALKLRLAASRNGGTSVVEALEGRPLTLPISPVADR
jgi:low affinity Fe/Cu permease